MSLLIWTVGQLFGVALLIALCLALRVLIDALALYHHAGMRRIHHDRSSR
jgi:hypothetical protein